MEDQLLKLMKALIYVGIREYEPEDVEAIRESLYPIIDGTFHNITFLYEREGRPFVLDLTEEFMAHIRAHIVVETQNKARSAASHVKEA